jgi:predicted  nucleic acid-binding Zn-ribbon protein
MAPTLDSIDQQLTQWRDRLDCVNQNLIDLHGLYTYQRLSGTSGIPQAPLTGITLAQVVPALADLDELFQHVGLLADVINRATHLRQTMPRLLGIDAHLQEIDQLLSGESIQMPLINIPIANRSLLSNTTSCQTIAPEDLLQAMVNAFDRARTVVMAVEQAWSHLEPKLLALDQEILSLRPHLTKSELSHLEQTLQTLRHSIDSDPLAADRQFEQTLRPQLDAIRQKIAQEAGLRDRLQQSLVQSKSLMAKIQDTNKHLQSIAQERQEKVTTSLSPAPAPEEITALQDWLDRLIDRQAAVSAVSVGIDRWLTQGHHLLSRLEQALQDNRQALDSRRELRGRLSALQAKAVARGWVEDAALVDLATQAKQMLYSRPTPLDEAQACLKRYERQLNQQNSL